VAIFDGCLPGSADDDGRSMGDIYVDHLRMARELLA